MMVDGRRAVAIAVVLLAAGLAPTAATFGGAPGVAVLGACAVAAVLLAWGGWLGGRVLPWLSGLDPTIPAFAPSDRLFGPRSGRAFGAAVAVPVASWVSFNVPVGQIADGRGTALPDRLRLDVWRHPAAARPNRRGPGGRRRDGGHRDRYRVAAAKRHRLDFPARLSRVRWPRSPRFLAGWLNGRSSRRGPSRRSRSVNPVVIAVGVAGARPSGVGAPPPAHRAAGGGRPAGRSRVDPARHALIDRRRSARRPRPGSPASTAPVRECSSPPASR